MLLNLYQVEMDWVIWNDMEGIETNEPMAHARPVSWSQTKVKCTHRSSRVELQVVLISLCPLEILVTR